ncbi:MAG: aspartate aminotransferase family protein [Bacteroidetes bacterium]|nr:aspartate aminotransferase family protein [Bacteroidota bacterium]MBU1113795.1 aspartate aminotransferase family protein [Bacteroidota bacterium]MBU1798291.1 aspartate aminotransferase family protein [Bacteroidota bacterium]
MKSSLLQNYNRYPVEFVKGKGSILYDKNGKEYLDFLSGIAVTGFGHQHATITDAANKQLNKLWHVSNLFEATPQEELAEKLTKATGMDSVFFCNSGSEANEAAIKFVRKWGGERKTIIAANGGFHGRTMGSLSATGQSKLWEGFAPMLPGFKFVDYSNIEQIKNSIDELTCAIMVEPIQGESGVIVPDENYLVELRKICDENNLLLILDEVQTGIGRTGKLFAHQYFDIVPDILTSAKGIANGLPLGATICAKKVSDVIKPGDHGSTFGGNPVAIAAANNVIGLLTELQLNYITNAGVQIQEAILLLKNPLVKTVRGKGLLIGVEFTKPIAKTIAKELLNEGIVVGNSGDSVLRLLPPFIITKDDIHYFVKIFTSVLLMFSFSHGSSDIANTN